MTPSAIDTNELRARLHMDFLQDYNAGKVGPPEYSVFLQDMPLESIMESVELFLQWLDEYLHNAPCAEECKGAGWCWCWCHDYRVSA